MRHVRRAQAFPQPRSAQNTQSTQNTVPAVYASSDTQSSSTSMPLAAIIVIAVLGGLLAVFIVYRIYRWIANYRARRRSVIVPEDYTPRQMTSPASNSIATLLSQQQRNAPFDPSIRFHRSESFNSLDSSSSPPSTPLANPDLLVLSNTKDHSTLSTNTLREARRFSVVSNSTLASYSSRSVSPHRRSYARSHSLPHSSSAPRLTRMSGAPHLPHSRVEVVPPAPLSPPGTVCLASKSSLAFNPSSTIGQSSEWFVAPSNASVHSDLNSSNITEHNIITKQQKSAISHDSSTTLSREGPPVKNDGGANSSSSSSSSPGTVEDNEFRSHESAADNDATVVPSQVEHIQSPLSMLQSRLAEEARRSRENFSIKPSSPTEP